MIESIVIGCSLIMLGLYVSLYLKYGRIAEEKETQYYTDYTHKGIVFRVFKYADEFRAVESIPHDKILDGGVLNEWYCYIMFEKF